MPPQNAKLVWFGGTTQFPLRVAPDRTAIEVCEPGMPPIRVSAVRDWAGCNAPLTDTPGRSAMGGSSSASVFAA
jgi:hypothetical protein